MTLVLLSSLLACGGQKAAPVAAGAEAGSARAPASVKGDFPGDPASQAFLATLSAMELPSFSAVDGGGASVMMRSMRFKADNTWAGSGYTDFGEERMDCSESGTWTMEPASSATVATVSWKLEQTDCVGRTAGTENRAVFTIVGEDIEVAFR